MLFNWPESSLFVFDIGSKSAASQFDFAWPFHFLDPPDYDFSDIQTSAECISYSHSAITSRWTLRFWSDTRAIVINMIDLPPATHAIDRTLTDIDTPSWIPAC